VGVRSANFQRPELGRVASGDVAAAFWASSISLGQVRSSTNLKDLDDPRGLTGAKPTQRPGNPSLFRHWRIFAVKLRFLSNYLA